MHWRRKRKHDPERESVAQTVSYEDVDIPLDESGVKFLVGALVQAGAPGVVTLRQRARMHSRSRFVRWGFSSEFTYEGWTIGNAVIASDNYSNSRLGLASSIESSSTLMHITTTGRIALGGPSSIYFADVSVASHAPQIISTLKAIAAEHDVPLDPQKPGLVEPDHSHGI